MRRNKLVQYINKMLYELGESFSPPSYFPFQPGEHIARVIAVPLHEFIEMHSIPLSHVSRWADLVQDKLQLTPYIQYVFNWETKRNEYRVYYFHHGIVVHDGNVIHFTRLHSMMKTSLQEFAQGQLVYKIEYDPHVRLCRSSQTVATAEDFLQHPIDYNGVYTNCEHFAVFCKTNQWHSSQIDELKTKLFHYGSERILDLLETIIRVLLYVYTFPEGQGFFLALGVIVFILYSVFWIFSCLKE